MGVVCDVIEDLERGVLSTGGSSSEAGLGGDSLAMKDGYVVLELGIGVGVETLILMLHEELVARESGVQFYGGIFAGSSVSL